MFSFSEAGMWKRKRWKLLNFCESESTLKKEAGSGSEFGSIFHKTEAGMWKRKRWTQLIFFRSGSTLKKEAGSGSKLESN